MNDLDGAEENSSLDGAKSDGENTDGLQGKIPHFLNALTAVSILAALTNALPKIENIFFKVTRSPCLCRVVISSPKHLFSGLIKPTSRGCSLWVQWGGKQMIVTLFSFAISIIFTLLMCDACPSSVNKTGFSGPARENLINSSNHFSNICVFTYNHSYEIALMRQVGHHKDVLCFP